MSINLASRRIPKLAAQAACVRDLFETISALRKERGDQDDDDDDDDEGEIQNDDDYDDDCEDEEEEESESDAADGEVNEEDGKGDGSLVPEARPAGLGPLDDGWDADKAPGSSASLDPIQDSQVLLRHRSQKSFETMPSKETLLNTAASYEAPLTSSKEIELAALMEQISLFEGSAPGSVRHEAVMLMMGSPKKPVREGPLPLHICVP